MNVPKYPSSDNDPLFTWHRRKSNLRILEVDDLKSIPYTTRSHPFIERLIGTIRREFLDRTFFWYAVDLERTLADFKIYYNHHRARSTLNGDTPAEVAGGARKLQTTLKYFRWQTHCRGRCQLPAAA
jgi:transposase InsO family protein